MSDPADLLTPRLARLIGPALADAIRRARRQGGRVPPEVEAFVNACLAARPEPVSPPQPNSTADAAAPGLELLTIEQAAELLKVSPQFVRQKAGRQRRR